MPKLKFGKHYTSTMSGITKTCKGWLQLISQMQFGRELCMTAPSLWQPVIDVFNEYCEKGIFVPTKEV